MSSFDVVTGQPYSKGKVDFSAVFGQELLSFSFPGAGALQLVPLSLHLIAVSDGQGLGSNDNVVITIGLIAPQGAGGGDLPEWRRWWTSPFSSFSRGAAAVSQKGFPPAAWAN